MGLIGPVLGHLTPQNLYRAALAAGRLAPAYLLTGQAGIGKATLARRLVALLLCRGPESARPCGGCAACGRLARGTHPAFHLLAIEEDEHEIKIESVRALIGSLAFRPADDDPAVVLIDDVDRVSEEGQNALLKILEEPPPYARFLLTTSRPEAVLPTVVSRCQVLRCAPLAEADVAAVLRANGALPEAEAALFAALSGGSPGRAGRWLQSGLLEGREWIASVFEALRSGDGHPAVAPFLALGEGAGSREGSRTRFRDALDLLLMLLSELRRGILAGRRGALASLLPPAAERWAGRSGAEGIAEAMERILDAQADIDHNVNPSLVVEDLFLRLAGIAEVGRVP